ncbi:MAG: hypothetical protein ACI30S_07080 [Muribaculaceae bacterium]
MVEISGIHFGRDTSRPYDKVVEIRDIVNREKSIENRVGGEGLHCSDNVVWIRGIMNKVVTKFNKNFVVIKNLFNFAVLSSMAYMSVSCGEYHNPRFTIKHKPTDCHYFKNLMKAYWKNLLTILLLCFSTMNVEAVKFSDCISGTKCQGTKKDTYTIGSTTIQTYNDISVTESETVEFSYKMELYSQVNIESGVTLTIRGVGSRTDTGGKWPIWNKLPDTGGTSYSLTSNWKCMFYVKPGGKLIIENVDINGNAHNNWTYHDIEQLKIGGANFEFLTGFGRDSGYEDTSKEASAGGKEYRPLIYGAIYNSGSLELTGCQIHDVNSKKLSDKSQYTYWRGFSAVTISGKPLSPSYAPYGSVASVTSAITTTITDCDFFENINYFGPALLTRHCGGTNTINITNSNFYHNVSRIMNPSIFNNTGDIHEWCGIIRTEGHSNATMNLTGVKVYENFVNGECAGVFFNAQKITLNGCEIYKNEALKSGGGLRIETNCEFTGSPTKVHDNTAGTLGGGVYFYGYSSSAYESNTEDWVYNLNDNLEVYNNTAGTYGGGIAFDFTSGTNIGTGNIIANVNGGIIYGNSATNGGGGIYANNKSTKYPNITIYLNDGNIGKAGGANTATYGGGIYIDGMAISSTNAAGSANEIEVSYNEASQNGGGIYSNNGNLTLKGNLKVHDNMAAGGTIPCGGGIYCNGGTLTVNNADVYSNSAQDGAGVYAINSAILNIETGNISSNRATGWGAGIRAEEQTVINLKEGKINSNICDNKAGGVYLSNSTMNITGSAEITANVSTYETGGGIYAQNSTFVMNSGDIHNNSAYTNGAGIYAENSDVTINSGNIYENEAGTSGGGIYFVVGNAEATTKKNLTFGGGKIYDNKASTGSGGGVYISGFYSGGVENAAVFNMEAGTVSGNKALRVATDEELNADYNAAVKLGAGGGIYIQEGYATLGKDGSSETCEISGNECGQYGGGIYVTSSHGTSYDFASTLTMNNGVVKGNTAGKRGGGIYMKQSELTMSGGEVTDNTATSQHAGGLDINNTVFKMTGGKVSRNTAGERGGGIYYNNVADTGLGDDWKDRDFIFEGGEISYNTAGEYGGGVCIYTGVNESTGTNGSLYKLSGGKIEYNTADNGGGVYYNGWDITTLELQNTDITNNIAKVGGGLLAYCGTVNYTNGLIRYNKAKRRDEQAELLTMYNTSHCTYNSTTKQDEINEDVGGIGGGIFANNATINLNSGSVFGIYKNIADICADDILSNGNNTSVNLPDVSSMSITGFDVPKESLFWAQDYITSDEGYWRRPATPDYSNWVSPADRYRTKLYNKTEIGYIKASSTDKPSYSEYVCVALGYKLVEVTVEKSGLKPGDSAIISLYRKDNVQQSDKPYFHVVLTGNGEGTAVSRKLYLEPGTWTVLETDWSWAYTAAVKEGTTDATTVLNRPAIVRTLVDDSSDRTFSFTNTPQTTAPHAEGVKENEFKETTE